jgi:hypothetical protein
MNRHNDRKSDEENLPSYISQSSILSGHATARGWAISICPIPTEYLSAQPKPLNTLHTTSSIPSQASESVDRSSKIQLDPTETRRRVTAGCESVIGDEARITEYDTIVGDGDCGYTLRDGAKQVLSFLAAQSLEDLSWSLSRLVDELEVSMGGTSGALYCIFLSALAQALKACDTFPDAVWQAKESLCQYTSARVGDRTCMDCLIPFADCLKETGDAAVALKRAAEGVGRTEMMDAKLGRSSYLDESATRGVPDPGAYGLLKLLEGMVGV